jgi:hypothetical protein
LTLGKRLTGIFRDVGAANTMDSWKIGSERRLMQVTVLYCAADHSMGLATWCCWWWSTIVQGSRTTTVTYDECMLDHELRKNSHESTGTSMRNDDLQAYLDLRRADLDPERFAAAVALHSIRRLIAAGGGKVERPDEQEALSLHHLEAFLARAVETSKRTKRFEQEWRQLQRLIPSIQVAWECGQVLFQEDLARATANPEVMEYLSMIDFAEDCYAAVVARRTYPHDPVQQAWARSGYMVAWWQHVLVEEDTSL